MQRTKDTIEFSTCVGRQIAGCVRRFGPAADGSDRPMADDKCWLAMLLALRLAIFLATLPALRLAILLAIFLATLPAIRLAILLAIQLTMQ